MKKLKQALSNPRKPQFSPQPHLTTHFCNSIINRHSSKGAHASVLHAYISLFQPNNISPDAYTYPSLLKSCTFFNLFPHGVLFHQQIIVNGFSSDAYVASSLINFYAKFGYTNYARYMFDGMSNKNVVPWTAMIGCYSRIGDVGTAFSMYKRMVWEGVRPSSVTMLALLSGVCEDVLSVECLCGCVVKLGFDCHVAVVNSMVSLFGKYGRVEDARKLFESMGGKDIVSWNSLVSGYALTGNVREVMFLINRMRFEGLEPDHQTFGALVSATVRQNNVNTGKLVHAHILSSDFQLDLPVKTLLISMYLKFGNHDYAYTIFKQTLDKDTMLWTTMISGLVQNDFADRAVVLFREMLSSGVMPSSVTVACALAACAHIGALDLGTSIHGYMVRQHMSVEVATQNSLVTINGKAELGETIAEEILMLQPGDAGKYMQLAHNYASTARWDDVGKALIQMRSQGLKKLPGWSFFESQGTITTFFTDHSSHPQYEEIVAILMFLSKEIRKPDIMTPEKEKIDGDYRNFENTSFLMQELLHVES
ncbi:hypothetical protein ACET3Z_013341 [Daucus carota]